MADMNAAMLGMPPETDPLEYAKALRQQQLAEIAMQSALTPASVQQPQGSNRGFYQAAKVSPLSPLIKLAEAYMARKGLDTSNQNMAQMYARGLQAFDPNGGGAQPAPVSAPVQPSGGVGVPAASGGYGGGAGASDAGQPGTTGAPQVNPMNPWGYDPRSMMRLYMTDPQKYIEAIKPTPEWQNYLLMAGGDSRAATQLALGAAAKQRSIEMRGGNTAFDPMTGRGIVAPEPTAGVQYSGDPFHGGISASPIPGAAEISANKGGLETAVKAANTPVQVSNDQGQPTFIRPGLNPVGLQAPATPALGSLGQAGGGAAPGAPAAAEGASSYFKPRAGGGGGSLQTTAGKAAQEAGGTSGQDYSKTLAVDSANALEVRRSLAELKNLAKTAVPGAANPLKLQVGTMMTAAGADPATVSAYLGVDLGALQAAQKQTAGLAVASIHQMTTRGTNFDLDTFMRNNPNFAQTPAAFARVVDFMDKKSKEIIDKQQDFQQWKKTGDNGQPVHPDEWMSGHTARWNKMQSDLIEAGKTNSRKPLDQIHKETVGGNP